MYDTKLVLSRVRSCSIPCHVIKLSSYSHSKPFSFPVSHEVVSNTCVVHHRDLPGLPTGGEQPHLRKFSAPTPWQALCFYRRINTVWGAFTAVRKAILALDQVQPDVPLLWSQIILFSDEDHQDRCPSVQLQLRGH